MKKYFILFGILLVLFVVGIGNASDENEQIYKANQLINDRCNWKGSNGWDYTYVFTHELVKADTIYLKLIYQEEKKQTKMLQQIMKKLDIKESL